MATADGRFLLPVPFLMTRPFSWFHCASAYQIWSWSAYALMSYCNLNNFQDGRRAPFCIYYCVCRTIHKSGLLSKDADKISHSCALEFLSYCNLSLLSIRLKIPISAYTSLDLFTEFFSTLEDEKGEDTRSHRQVIFHHIKGNSPWTRLYEN